MYAIDIFFLMQSMMQFMRTTLTDKDKKFCILRKALSHVTEFLNIGKIIEIKKIVEKSAEMFLKKNDEKKAAKKNSRKSNDDNEVAVVYDEHRKMLPISSEDVQSTPFVSFICSFIEGIFKEFDDTTLKISDPSYLISNKGGGTQTFHYDYDQTPKASAIDNAQSGYFVMIAFMNNTKMIVFDEVLEKQVEIILNCGDVFIGRGDLLHAGASYEDVNLRLHFYIDRTFGDGAEVPRKYGETYFPNEDMDGRIDKLRNEELSSYVPSDEHEISC